MQPRDLGCFLFFFLKMTNLPDYYEILGVSPSATQDEIREGNKCNDLNTFIDNNHNIAYKKEALLNHPDRMSSSATPSERQEATRRFQLVADAYYTLGDRSRRESYDRSRSHQDRFTPFSSARPSSSPSQANHLFGDVFEELLRAEGKKKIIKKEIQSFLTLFVIVEHPSYHWRILGAGAGAILGFIFGNIPGAAIVSVFFLFFVCFHNTVILR